MIKNISIGVTNAIRAYLGESLVWQAPKLTANFTTGEYKASGEAKTFAEVFDFNRAGNAWLVKDTGLVEYAIDAPRFDGGLLLEQAATNLSVSRLAVKCIWVGANVVLDSDGTANQTGYLSTRVNYVKDAYMTTTLHIKSENAGLTSLLIGDAGIISYSVNVKDATYVKVSDHPLTLEPSIKTAIGDFGTRMAFTRKGLQDLETAMRYNIPSAAYSAIGSNLAASARYAQHETGKVSSSYIPTTTTPVTRPADFLQTKVSGTTITGDWDSTLNLSISNGQIVHSGYGHVRSLEIN